MPVTIVGLIEEMREIITKKNEKMAFIKVADFYDSLEVVVFPKVYAQFKDYIALEKCVAIKGKFSVRDGEPSVLADAVKLLDT